MKVLRRSLKTTNDRERSSHSPITPKSAIAIVPPKKVIRAIHEYEAQTDQELSFQKGDFFHVIGRENETDWYEACNPAVPDARGLVPVAFFQCLGKTERDSSQSEKHILPVRSPQKDSGYSEMPSITAGSIQGTARSSRALSKGTGSMVYGVVLYDFVSERPDELDAKVGEAIIVIAQSNPEWFVAKPIGRLGGPGLIPVSFIEIRDMITGEPVPNPLEAIQRARVPKVEEWKKMAAEYKNSSISLGKFENPQQRIQYHNSQQMDRDVDTMIREPDAPKKNGISLPKAFPAMSRNLQELYLSSAENLPAAVSARIPRYYYANDKYWFVIEVQLEDGRIWELSRIYEDFYDFQIQLLNEFPTEAGNTGQQQRTLPFMPGPVSQISDNITEGRQNNLDAYVKHLLAQPPHISRCDLVKEFFIPRDGDIIMAADIINEEYRFSGGSVQSSNDSMIDEISRLSLRGNLNGSNPSGLSISPQHQSGPSVQSAIIPSTQQTMKVKIYYGNDLIAIRVPTDVQFVKLFSKIRDRLKIPAHETMTLSYKDDNCSERPLLTSNEDLDLALSRNDKLVIYVE